jgi:hypothetical protein
MVALVWIALAVFVVAVVAGGVLAAVRGLATWRAFRSFRRRFDESSVGMLSRLETTERRLAQAGETAQRLDRARARLEQSLAAARALAAAAAEAKGLADQARGFAQP